MNEWLFVFVLLLPIAWYFGYRKGSTEQPKNTNSIQSALSKPYFAGLNYLLNEQQDKAIDSFASMLEVNSDTADIQLALGNLYRKRGEVDRSIRIHQNLIARPSLASTDKNLALLELGYDYMAAGLLDRAENIFHELSGDLTHHEVCIQQLLAIYQLTNEWNKAIQMAAKLQTPLSEANSIKLSHFYCELAQDSLKKSEHGVAKKFIKKAHQTSSNCVRATLLHAELHMSIGEYKKALKGYREIILQDITFLPEAIAPIVNCYSHLDNKIELEKYLQEVIKKGGGTSVILAYAEILQVKSGAAVASKFIAAQLEKQPSLKGVLRLIELQVESTQDSGESSLLVLNKVVSKLLEDKPVYHCSYCGFDSKSLFWQCPGCKSWGSVKPIIGIEGE